MDRRESVLQKRRAMQLKYKKLRTQVENLNQSMRDLVRERVVQLEELAKSEKEVAPLSKTAIAALIVKEKEHYGEKAVRDAENYLKPHISELETMNSDDALKIGITGLDILRISMAARDSPAEAPQMKKKTKETKPKTKVPQKKKEKEEVTEDEKDKIRADMQKAREEGFTNRTQLAMLRRSLFNRAKKAGVIDEVFPQKEKTVGLIKLIRELSTNEKKLREIVLAYNVRAAKDFMLKVPDGAQIYSHAKFNRKLLQSVLKSLAKERPEEREMPGKSKTEPAASPRVSREEKKESEAERKENIRKELLEAKESGIESRAELTQRRRSLYNRAKDAGVLDEVFPKKKRVQGTGQLIDDVYNNRKELTKICRENDIRTPEDFIRKLELGSKIYYNSKFNTKLLRSVLESLAEGRKEAEDKPPTKKKNEGEIKRLVREVYNKESKLKAILKEKGIKTIDDFKKKIKEGARIFLHPMFELKLLFKLLKELREEGAESGEGPIDLKNYVKERLPTGHAKHLDEVTEAIQKEGEYDLSKEEDKRVVEDKLLGHLERLEEKNGRKRAKPPKKAKSAEEATVFVRKRTPSGIVERPAVRKNVVTGLKERGFIVDADLIKSVMESEGLSEKKVKMYISAIIRGFKLGSKTAAVGGKGFDLNIVKTNIRNIHGVTKPIKVIDFLRGKGVLIENRARGGDHSYAVEYKTDNIDPGWRPLISLLLELRIARLTNGN